MERERGVREKLERALAELEQALADVRALRRQQQVPSREALGQALARLSAARSLLDEAAREA